MLSQIIEFITIFVSTFRNQDDACTPNNIDTESIMLKTLSNQNQTASKNC